MIPVSLAFRSGIGLWLTTMLLSGCSSVPPLSSTDAAWVPAAAPADIERHVDALMTLRPVHAPTYTADGESLYYTSSRDGTHRLYAHRLDDGGERVVAPDWPGPIPGAILAGGDRLLFVADSGGDDLTHVYTLDARTGKVEKATSQVLTRDSPITPSAVPGTFYYSARQPDASQAIVMRLRLDASPGESEVYRDSGFGFLSDVSPDGRRGLFLRFLNYQSNRVVVVDLEHGRAHDLYPAQGDATVRAAVFSRDGARVYLTTDGGTEQASVLALDSASGRVLARFDETQPRTATGEQLVLSRDGERLAVLFNAGDHHIVRLLDAGTLNPAVEVALPLGSGELGEFAPDGRHLALAWRTPEHPTAIYQVDTGSGRSQRVIGDGATQDDAGSETSIETLGSEDGLRFPVIVTRPTTPGRHPVIVDFHGGPAGSATIGWSPSARLATLYGIAYVQPNIRGSGGFGREFEASDDGHKRRESFRDIDALVDWLRQQPWVDPQRLVIKGSSYGGYLVAQQIAEHPGRWRAAVKQFGIVDFISFMQTTTGLVRQNYLREIGDPERDRELLEDLSPITRVDRIVTPLFIYAGANDPRVPRAQSDLLAASLRQRGVQVEYMLAENEGHGASAPATQRELAVRSMRVVLRNLTTGEPGL